MEQQQQLPKRSFVAPFAGAVVTIIYLVGITCLRWNDLGTLRTIELDKLGSFLAGVFGPVSFLWLILGYIQQQQELALNTNALQLQAQELKASVEQQKELVNETRQQVEIQRKAHEREELMLKKDTEPLFVCIEVNTHYFENGIKLCSFKFRNEGKIATGISIISTPIMDKFTSNLTKATADSGETVASSFKLENGDELPDDLLVAIAYTTGAGQKHVSCFLFEQRNPSLKYELVETY